MKRKKVFSLIALVLTVTMVFQNTLVCVAADDLQLPNTAVAAESTVVTDSLEASAEAAAEKDDAGEIAKAEETAAGEAKEVPAADAGQTAAEDAAQIMAGEAAQPEGGETAQTAAGETANTAAEDAAPTAAEEAANAVGEETAGMKAEETARAEETEADPAEGSTTYKASYSHNLYVEAVAPAGAFSEPVTLVAETIPEDSRKYENAVNQMAAAGEAVEDRSFAVLDIRFVAADGRELEPNQEAGPVQVSLKAVDLLSEEEATAGFAVEGEEAGDQAAPEEIGVYHITDAGQVESVAEAEEKNGVVKATFEVSEFSTFVIVRNGADFGNYSKLSDAIRNVNDGETIKVTAGGSMNETGISIPAGKSITLDLNGETLQSSATTNGTAYTISVNGSLTIMDSSAAGTGTLKGTTTKAGLIEVNAGGSLTLESGTITGQTNTYSRANNAQTVSYRGGAIALKGNEKNKIKATFVMNGGTISDCHVQTGNGGDGKDGTGAAITTSYGDVTIKGGTISGCTAAKMGGAIYLADWSTFTMTGGTVTNNTAGEEGGGIALGYGGECSGLITGGYITDNTSTTSKSWGGGGIFVSTYANMTIMDAYIVGNDAQGFGGGISSCPTGKNTVNGTEGAAVFGNTAAGNNTASDSVKVEDKAAKTAKDAGTFVYYQDYYSPESSNAQQGYVLDEIYKSNYGSTVSGVMLGGGDANWTANTLDGIIFKVNNEEIVDSQKNEHLGMQANPSAADQEKAKKAAKVFITGNKSNVHGGGIMNNGMLTFGTKAEDNDYKPLELEITKTTTGIDPKTQQTLSPAGFQFDFRTDKGASLQKATSDANGKATFTLNISDLKTLDVEQSFDIVELAGTNPNVQYDGSKYRVKMTLYDEVTKKTTKKKTTTDSTGTTTVITTVTTRVKEDGTTEELGTVTEQSTHANSPTSNKSSTTEKIVKEISTHALKSKNVSWYEWNSDNGTWDPLTAQPTFRNSIKEPEVQLQVKKAVAGSGYTGSENFSFLLADANDATVSGYTMPTKVTETAANNATATFDAIRFSKTGTYYFTITEKAPATKTSGMSYDETAKYAKVVVDLDSAGAWRTTVTYGDTKEKATASGLTVTNTYSEGVDLEFSKTDLGGTEVDGADMKITGTESATGQSISEITWSSQAKNPKKVTLKPGKYVLSETTPPTGYQAITNVEFTVNDNGTVTVTKTTTTGAVEFKANGSVVVKDAAKPVTITLKKSDITGTPEVAGAKLKITGKAIGAANEITPLIWESKDDGTVQQFSLLPGEYVLTETAAPKGYAAITEVKFTVEAGGTVKVTQQSTTGTVAVSGTTLIIKDDAEPVTVTFKKTDITGTTEVPGAKLKITGRELGAAADIQALTWESKNDGTIQTFDLKPGEYVLTETAAPNGYKAITEVKFKVEAGGKITVTQQSTTGTVAVNGTTVTVKDDAEPVNVNFKKTDITGTTEVAGAKLKITGRAIGAASDITPLTWDSKADGKGQTFSLLPGEYVLTETAAPNGYVAITEVKFRVEAGGKITVTQQTTSGDVAVNGTAVTIKDDFKGTEVLFSKKDIAGDEVVGAKLQITGRRTGAAADIKPILWTTEAGKDTKVNLHPGTYTLHEVAAPGGYEVITDVTFTLDAAGKITVTGGNTTGNVKVKGTTVTITDDFKPTKVTFKKTDITGTTEVPKAKLTITGTETGKTAPITPLTWESKDDGKGQEFSLMPGEYVLTETAAPNGYEAITEVKFTVEPGGKITVKQQTTTGDVEVKDDGTVLVKDEAKPVKVTLKKTDLTGTTEVPNAKLKITGRELGATADIQPLTWTSKADGKGQSFDLMPGEYVLTETAAPNGYAAITEVKFKVEAGGTVKVTRQSTTGTVAVSGTTVTIKDDAKPVKVTFTKTDITGTTEVPGAKLKITGRELGAAADIRALTWESKNDGTAQSFNLKPGEYVLTETAAPNGYEAITEVKFKVEAGGKITVTQQSTTGTVAVNGTTVTIKDDAKPVKVTFTKTDITGTTEVPGAKLKITGRELGAAADIQALTWDSKADGKGQEFSLMPGEYTLTETAAPNGYVAITEVQFTVEAGGKITVTRQTTSGDVSVNGTRVTILDDFKGTEVLFSKKDIAGDEVVGAKLQITGRRTGAAADIKPILWTTEAGKDTKVNLHPGTYTLHEVAAPNGYVAITDVIFTLDETGKITVTQQTTTGNVAVKGTTVTVTDDFGPTRVVIKKTDITGTTEVPNARLEVTGRETGKTTDITPITWDSKADGKGQEFSLMPGEYTLKETAAPNGYEAITEVKFKVEAGGKVTVTRQTTTGDVEVKGTTILVKDEAKPVKVIVKKTDITGTTEVPNARLEVTGREIGKTTDITPITWDSKADGKGREFSLMPGEYTLKETAAPSGYEAITEVKFRVEAGGKITVTQQTTTGDVEVKDGVILVKDDFKPTKVTFKKTDITGTTEVANAKLELTGRETGATGDITPLTWTSKADGKGKTFTLMPGEYTLKETAAPGGYVAITEVKFTLDRDGKITVTQQTTTGDVEVKNGTILVKDDFKGTEVLFGKKDIMGNEVAGATLTITGRQTGAAQDIKPITWTTEAGKDTRVNLHPGTYTLREVAAPSGYEVISDVTFTLDALGKITVTGSTTTGDVTVKGTTVTITDDFKPTRVIFRKTDVTGTTEVANAKLELTGRETGATKDITPITWTSDTTGKGKEFPLMPGEYTLKEVAAPNGYEAITEVKFTVEVGGKITVTQQTTTGDVEVKDGTILVKDDAKPVKVTLRKTDITGTTEVANATLELTGREIGASDDITPIIWQSDITGKGKELELMPGEYTLKETAAPSGYEAITEVKFTVEAGGRITVKQQTTTGDVEVNGTTVTVKDDYQGTEVLFSKRDIVGDEVAGARLTITGRKTGAAQDIEPVQWTSEVGKEHKVKLYPGTYTLHEVAAPNGYEAITDVTFTLDQDGNITVTGSTTTGNVVVNGTTVTITDDYEPTKVIFRKTDITGTREVANATLVITGRETGADEDITPLTWRSKTDGKGQEFELLPGEYTLKETAAPSGYVAITEVKFLVEVGGKITVTQQTTTGDVEVKGNTVLVKNDAEEEEDDQDKDQDTPDSDNKTDKPKNKTTNKTNPRTGDDSNTMGWLILMLAASIGLGVLLGKKGKKTK